MLFIDLQAILPIRRHIRLLRRQHRSISYQPWLSAAHVIVVEGFPEGGVPISIRHVRLVPFLSFLLRRLAAPEHRLPYLAEITIKIFFFISGIAARYSVHDEGLFVVIREQLIFNWTNVTQVDKILIVWLDPALEAEISELILDLVLLILLINELEIPHHILLEFVALIRSYLRLLFNFHVS